MGLALGVLYLQINFILVAILSGLIEISVYSCGELRKAGSERKIDMKKLVIILAIVIMLFATQEQHTKEPASTAAGVSQNVTTEQMEKVHETHSEQTEETTVVACTPVPTDATKEETVVQETLVKECTEEQRDLKAAESEEAVQCVDKGNQSLAEYKPQDSGQPNPFENAPPAEIVDQPVEDLISEGEDRPGEGKHF